MAVDNIEEALFSLITTNSGVASLISTRLYPEVIPEKATIPAACYQLITTERVNYHNGPSEFAGPRFQITVTGKTYAEAKSVIRAIRKAVNGYRGTKGTVKIFGIFIDNEYDGAENLETDYTTLRMDIRVNWLEDI